MKATPQTRAPENSASADGGLSGGSRVRRPGSKDPHRHERNLGNQKWGEKDFGPIGSQISSNAKREGFATPTMKLSSDYQKINVFLSI